MHIKKGWIAKLLAAALLLACLMGSAAMAAESSAPLASEQNGKSLFFYILNPGEIESISGQIGTTPCEQSSALSLSEAEAPMRTLLLLDNSLSTTEDYRPAIQEIMAGLIDNHAEGELFSIATFSEEITYLLQDSSDYAKLKQTMEKIEYASQNTYLTDVLYELLSDWAEDGEIGYRRIVLFSDGLDNRVIGYTREELMELLKEHACPIYSIGCAPAKEDTAGGLENMFALSRATGGFSWLFADIASPDEVIEYITEAGNVICVKMTVPDTLCDGAQRGVKLSVQTAEGTQEFSTTMRMPFGESTEMDAAEEKGIPVYVILLAVVLAAAAAGALIWRRRKQQEDETRFRTAPAGAAPKLAGEIHEYPTEGATEMLTEYSYSSGETAMIWETGRLILIDEKNGSKRFEASLLEPIKIGRGRDTGCTIVLDYDTSVSRRPHCQIRMENGVVLVKDLGSSNGTYLNGKRLEQETAIVDGDLLKIGRVEMRVELR